MKSHEKPIKTTARRHKRPPLAQGALSAVVHLLLLVIFNLTGLVLAINATHLLVQASKPSTQAPAPTLFFSDPHIVPTNSHNANSTTSFQPALQVPREPQPATSVNKQPSNERINLNEADQYGLYLVGLFDIHHSNPRVPFKCGPIDVDVGEWHSRRPMQNMEAFLWAIEQVNADTSLLPGVRLGSLVMDTCSSFLRTNQQLANLLHGGGSPHPANGKVTSNRQIAAIVADNSDWQSVEAVVSMASAQGLTTFVTQSRSSKLSELARKYKPAGNQLDLNPNLRLSLQPQHPLTPEAAISQHEQLGRRSDAAAGPLAPPLDGLLSELLGIGRMTTPRPTGNGPNSSWWAWPEDQQQQQQAEQQQHKLYMVRMLLGNELLADAIGSLVQQMNWDLISVIYDDDPELVDLHDELIKQLFARNIQLALDEQLPMGAPTENYDRSLQMLAKKSGQGARVVITLLGTGSARLLLDSLHHLRNSASSRAEQINQVNSLLWITITDREPYYSFATDALGTVAISSSVSLIPEFRSYYDKLASELHAAPASPGHSSNRWWPEYMKAILLKHQRDIELISNECARWQEPRASPLNEKCRSLTLSSLVQLEKSANHSSSGKSTFASPAPAPANAKSRLMNTLANGQPSAPFTGGYSDGQQQPQQQPSKLAKYLANGWEHNGMDIINSVLAVANGLESIRQTMCPNQQVGLCDRMRELVSAGPLNGQSPQATNKLPLLSELIYNELLRSTFQLADGRMFNLDDFNSPSGQVEGKFKLYNLRYLQQNSIGFVKFGTYDQLDGLELNTTKARHYPRANSYLDQEPLETVKSTCEDENKCLMFGALNKQQQQQGGFSEEELAAGVNSLFKLDHPMLIPAEPAGEEGSPGRQQQAKQQQAAAAVAESLDQSAAQRAAANGERPSQPELAGTDDVSRRHNQQQQQQTVSRPAEDLQIHTMRSPPAMSRLNWSSAADHETTSATATARTAEKATTFNTIVLLPLHKGYQSSGGGGCSERLDMEHSFQLLAALAYVQQKVNGVWPLHLPASSSGAHQAGSGDAALADNNARNRNGDVLAKPQIELTTTVIDYCDQLEMAKTKLLAKLVASTTFSSSKEPTTTATSHNRLGQQQQQRQETPNRLPVVGKTVAVIDFDAQISENIDSLLEDRQVLHLTIGSSAPTPSYFNHQLNINYKSQPTIIGGANSAEPSSDFQPKPQPLAGEGNKRKQLPGHNHLKLSLMPSKSNEIQALVQLISSMELWRLVHLIYTDHHHYRDEFVRRANEANICVSKLIWIPSIVGGDGMNNESAGGFSDKELASGGGAGGDNGNANAAGTGAGENHSRPGTGTGGGGARWDARQVVQLEKTRALFARELHDYRSSTDRTTTATTTGSARRPTPDPVDAAQGLNSTRILVVLASANDATNQMILEAATESMLEDYVWLTSHEWLASVELAAAAASVSAADPQLAPTSAPILPRYYLSTRRETYESHDFRRYLSSLTPAIHAPLPSKWFDEFWQQHFRCRLPIAAGGAAEHQNRWPNVCGHHQQHIDTSHRWAEEDRVHYVIEAVESLQEALAEVSARNATEQLLSREFMRSLARRRQLGSPATDPPPPMAHLPYGYHIVHRLLPPHRRDNATRRANSRDLSLAESRAQGQLLRVGLWRDGQLVLNTKEMNQQQQQQNYRWYMNSRASGSADGSGDPDQDAGNQAIRMSLRALSSIKSRCSSGETCSLCRQQVEQTMAVARQEAAHLNQSESVAEPNAVSSIWLAATGRNQPPVDVSRTLDWFDDDAASGGGGDDDKLAGDTADTAASRDIQAVASSLFVDRVANKLDVGRQVFGEPAGKLQRQQIRWSARDGQQQPPISLNLRHAPALLTSMLSLLGVLVMVASMTYLYPNMLERAMKKTSTGGVASKPGSGQATHTLSNINDYFLLTGLLMLYSINMAFLLPATMGVCWFRRIGLATSYTVIFSSILVKVLNSCRQSSRQRTAPLAQGAHPAQINKQQQVVDPLEDGVEVTFESLGHNNGNLASVDESEAARKQTGGGGCCSTIDTSSGQLADGYQTSGGGGGSPKELVKQAGESQWSQRQAWYSCRDPATLLTISICLILSQVVVSLVWFIQQPPEPTLYFACWRCASPIRSPILFLYEPLLSLLYPGLILVFTWSLSIIAYRLASQNEEQFRSASRRLLGGGSGGQRSTLYSTSQEQELKWQLRQLDQKLRDAKSLVMATTLTVFVWSSLTLNMISSSQKLLQAPQVNVIGQPGPFYSANHQQSINDSPSSSSSASTKTVNDLSLVYANILSGAIIFSFLFIYRLHLLHLPRRPCSSLGKSISKRLARGGVGGTGGSVSSGSVLKFNDSPRRTESLASGNKWFGGEDMYPVPAGDSFFTGSQFSAASSGRHERLKLQQFSSSYGTYSAGGPVAAPDNYHTSTTINPLHSLASTAGPPLEPSAGKLSLKRRHKTPSSFFGASSPFGSSGSIGSKKKKPPPVPKPRTSSNALAGNGSLASQTGGGGGGGGSFEFKLQRRQSSGSVASSTAKLVGDNSSMDNVDDMFMDDTISCASSVASSSTSQLHGNDLYPIDCSIQLDSQLPNSNSFMAGPTLDSPLNRSSSFNRRSSLRRSLNHQATNKLSSVREEQASGGKQQQQQQQLTSLDSGTEANLSEPEAKV